MKIVLATRNRKKVEELKRMFIGYSVIFQTLDAFPACPDVLEDGRTFRQNAVKKAVAIARHTGCIALADDSGLEVDVLDRAPGVFSARYAGKDASDSDNVKKLLRELRGVDDPASRTARFVCCIALALPDGKVKTFTGHVNGTIGKLPKGHNGFGYDPIFYPTDYRKTFAEMGDREKDDISHRGKAMKKLYAYLKKLLD